MSRDDPRSSSNAVTAHVAVLHGSFTAKIEVPATASEVFAAYGKRPIREKWFRMPGRRVGDHKLDFAVGGGEYLAATFAPGEDRGELLEYRSQFLDIALDKRIVVSFIDAHKDRETDGLRWGVEPTCRALQVAPSVYYAYKARLPSRRSVEDAELSRLIFRIWEENFCCYGAEKIWRQLQPTASPAAVTASRGSCVTSASVASSGASPVAPRSRRPRWSGPQTS